MINLTILGNNEIVVMKGKNGNLIANGEFVKNFGKLSKGHGEQDHFWEKNGTK